MVLLQHTNPEKSISILFGIVSHRIQQIGIPKYLGFSPEMDEIVLYDSVKTPKYRGPKAPYKDASLRIYMNGFVYIRESAKESYSEVDCVLCFSPEMVEIVLYDSVKTS